MIFFIKYGYRCVESVCGFGVFVVFSKWKCLGICGKSVKREIFICVKRFVIVRFF